MKIKRLGRFLSICMCILKILLKSINIVITYEQLKMVKIFFYNKFKNFSISISCFCIEQILMKFYIYNINYINLQKCIFKI